MIRRLLVPLGAAALLFLAGCGDDGDGSAGPTITTPVVTATSTDTTQTTQTTPEPSGPRESTVSVYFLRDDEVAAARRTLRHSGAVAAAAIRALIRGPTVQEGDAGLSTTVPPDARLASLTIEDGTATIDFAQPDVDETELRRDPLVAQVVYTLTQFPSVKRVVFARAPADGKGLTRTDMEDFTPPIFVESPVVGETVRSPIRVRGTANTFEATYQLRVEADGRKVAERFDTATSGSGTRGTFDTTIAVPEGISGPITLVVFEYSAEDGRPIHVVRIPLDLAR